MQLPEFEGKRLFRRHGIPVPRGVLWPELPETPDGFVVKAQIAEGGRGKRGGIRFAATAPAAAAAAEALLGSVIGGHRVDEVYVEERLDIAAELYLSVVLDRGRCCYAILAAPRGGVDVEARAVEGLVRLPLDPLSAPGAAQLDRTVAALGLSGATADAARALVASLTRLVLAEDAQLAEINPLALTEQGALVAADARVVLDPNAAFRHPEWRGWSLPPEGSDVERAIAATGSVAVEVDPAGDILAVVSGAGLMMATLDMLVAGGGRPRLMIDLGGVVLAGAERIVPVLRAATKLAPKATFFNAYFQTALCDHFARALADAHAELPLTGAVVVRLKGRNDGAARRILEPLGFTVMSDLEPALAATLAAARSRA